MASYCQKYVSLHNSCDQFPGLMSEQDIKQRVIRHTRTYYGDDNSYLTVYHNSVAFETDRTSMHEDIIGHFSTYTTAIIHIRLRYYSMYPQFFTVLCEYLCRFSITTSVTIIICVAFFTVTLNLHLSTEFPFPFVCKQTFRFCKDFDYFKPQ